MKLIHALWIALLSIITIPCATSIAEEQPSPLPQCTQKAVTNGKSMQMFFPDGQLTNRLLAIFVSNALISDDQHPKLLLMGQHTDDFRVDDQSFTAKLVDFNQRWTHESTISGGESMQVSEEGTLLLFDISSYEIPYIRPFMHVTPVIQWRSRDKSCLQQITMGEERPNLGSAIGIAINSLVLVMGFLIFLAAVAAHSKGAWWRIIDLLCEDNGKLSLSKVQMALWTVVIVAIVYAFSLSKMATPEIPSTLLLLMGASYATRALVKFQGGKSDGQSEAEDSPAQITHESPKLSHLISDSSGQLSLPRAQMLMWTVLSVVIFVTKSLLDGHMWDVPIELVALMGMSQLGYAVPNMKSDKKST